MSQNFAFLLCVDVLLVKFDSRLFSCTASVGTLVPRTSTVRGGHGRVLHLLIIIEFPQLTVAEVEHPLVSDVLTSRRQRTVFNEAFTSCVRL